MRILVFAVALSGFSAFAQSTQIYVAGPYLMHPQGNATFDTNVKANQVAPPYSSFYTWNVVVTGGDKRFVNQGSGKCLATTTLSVGTPIVQITCNQPTGLDTWATQCFANGCLIRRLGSNFCVEIGPGGGFPWVDRSLTLQPCNSSNTSQLWKGSFPL